jgi:hypothetical protein
VSSGGFCGRRDDRFEDVLIEIWNQQLAAAVVQGVI